MPPPTPSCARSGGFGARADICIFKHRTVTVSTPTPSIDLGQYVPYLLNRAARRIADTFGRELAAHGLALPAWRVMAALRSTGAQNLGTLSALTSIEVSTLSRLLAQMERQGLVVRARNRADARALRVAPTPRARALTDRLIPRALAIERAALQGMSDAEVALLKRLLVQLDANVDALTHRKWVD